MIVTVLLWGAVAGVVHFVVIAFLYGNPLVERISARAETESPAVKRWATKGKYYLTQSEYTVYSGTFQSFFLLGF